MPNMLPLIAALVTNLWSGELYLEGNQFEDITGGWIATTQKYAATVEGSSVNGVAPTLTVGAASLKAALSGSPVSGTMRTKNMIDLTDFTKLTLTGVATYHPYNMLYLTDNTGAYYGSVTNRAVLDTSDNVTELDISALSGKFYVCVGLYNTGSFEMTRCILS